MELIALPPKALRIGIVLPFALRDAEGKLLFAAGQVLSNTPQVQALIERGAYVAAHETREYQRARAHAANTLVMQGAVLDEIARAEAPIRGERPARAVELSEPQWWSDLQLRAHALLRAPQREDFLARFEALHQDAVDRARQRTDASLLVLIHDANQGFEAYSARHALLSVVLAELCGQQLGWDASWRGVLTRAALSMNLSISALQDRLAAQEDKGAHAHRQALHRHGDDAAELLLSLGVTDEVWLGSLRLHHDVGPGPLGNRSNAERIARVLHRVDVFGARLSPRRSRRALAGAAAARAVFMDELKQPDEAGSALIKAVGLYPPGSLVQLANGEVAIVVKRGHSANHPLVASLLGKSGNPLTEPVLRDTRLQSQAVASSLAPHELMLRLNMERLVRLSD